MGGRFGGTSFCLGTFWVILSTSNSTTEARSCSSLHRRISVVAPWCHKIHLKRKLNIFCRSQMWSNKNSTIIMKYKKTLTRTFPVLPKLCSGLRDSWSVTSTWNFDSLPVLQMLWSFLSTPDFANLHAERHFYWN